MAKRLGRNYIGFEQDPLNVRMARDRVAAASPAPEDHSLLITLLAPAKPLDHPVPFGNAPWGAMQGPRYYEVRLLKSAKTLVDIVGYSRAF